MKKQMEKYEQVENSIIKKFRKGIWRKFAHGVNDYDLIQEGDKIGVCISGGKDSMLLAKCMQELQKHWIRNFELEFIVMDPGYNPANRAKIEENAKILNIPIHIFETRIFDAVKKIENNPCYLCARMRRGYLYKFAKSLGCNKIALGHHFDDVIETILMGMIYGAQIQTMMPKVHSANYPGMELIRPMYYIKEADVKAWAEYNGLSFIDCACRFTEMAAQENKEHTSKRAEMKALVNHFRKINPYIEMNIFKSVHNVNLKTIIGYHDGDKVYNFLDDYDTNGLNARGGEEA
jgi:tRNA 2-thiocytidine biosynthesis protein TtcA